MLHDMQPIPAEPFFPTVLGLVLGALPIAVSAGIAIFRSRRGWVGEVAVVGFLVLLAAWAYTGSTFFTQQNAEARYELASVELHRVYGLDAEQADRILAWGRAGYLGYTQAPDSADVIMPSTEIDTGDGPVRVNLLWRDDAFRLFVFDREQGFVELERQ